jgi:hypothetical protein
MKLLRRAAFILIALISQTPAHGLVLPSGIAVDPDPSLDLTYQVVPDYDPVEKVIAGWMGDKLLYFVYVERLPAGWLDHDKYFQGLIRDLRAAGRSVETTKSGKYKAVSSLTGEYLQIQSKPSPQAAPSSQVVHFITDRKLAFVAFATLLDKGSADRMLEETKLLFQSASLQTIAPTNIGSVRSESPYVGTWKWSGAAPSGIPAIATMTLKDDLSFSSELTIGGRIVFRGVGVWSISGQRLLWTYLRSEPPLPADKREDEDETVTFDRGRLVLRSKLSGKEREFLHQ